MKLEMVDHTAFAVANTESVKAFYQKMGIFPDIETQYQGMRILFFSIGGAKVEYMQPLKENTPISNFLKREGAGLHHIAYCVEDLESFVQESVAAGLEFVSTTPEIGVDGRRVLFFHPMATFGTAIEIIESSKS